MGPYMVDPTCESVMYDLIGVLNHFGSGGGHYTAFCKNFVDEKWYNYDDNSVSPMDEKSVSIGYQNDKKNKNCIYYCVIYTLCFIAWEWPLGLLLLDFLSI
jgi:uncharacterized UBP type Zn finger protein